MIIRRRKKFVEEIFNLSFFRYILLLKHDQYRNFIQFYSCEGRMKNYIHDSSLFRYRLTEFQ